jgi:hypothetical protein
MITQWNYGYESIAQPTQRSTEYQVWMQAKATLEDTYDGLSLLEDRRPCLTELEYVTERGYWLHRIEASKAEVDRAWEAQEGTFQDCTCTPVSDACAVCVEANRVIYGDTIPVEGV